MPRTRRTAAAQKKTSLEDPLVLEGDPDGVAPAGKITREEKEHLRGLQMSFVKRMYEHAKEFLGRGPLLRRCQAPPGISICLSI